MLYLRLAHYEGAMFKINIKIFKINLYLIHDFTNLKLKWKHHVHSCILNAK